MNIRQKKILVWLTALVLTLLAIHFIKPGIYVRAFHFGKRQIVSVVDRNQKIMNIPVLAQTRNLNCEATTVQMLLAYYKKNPDIDTIQSAFPLDENPHKGFRGNVDGSIWGLTDYGVYAEPVAKVMNQFGVKAKAYKNISPDFLKQQILAGKPAIIWVSISNPHPEYETITVNGEEVKLVSGEHVVVVTGYSHGRWILNDPWSTTAKDGTRVPKQIYVDDLDSIRWSDFDHMAVIVE